MVSHESGLLTFIRNSPIAIRNFLDSMRRIVIHQGLPLVLAFLVFAAMWALLHAEVLALNTLNLHGSIGLRFLWPDVLVGMAIYLKTSIDFAIFIGHLMRRHPGWTNRIAIECGTAFGNALGTFVILALWTLFRSIDWLLALMVLVASLVLLKLAEEGLEHALDEEQRYPDLFRQAVKVTWAILRPINRVFDPVLGRLMPKSSPDSGKGSSWPGLLLFAATIPFILGLDDFAGYVPLFSLVHVYSFAIGVLAGHLVLNICLFLSPATTIRIVRQPIISFLGSLAFIGLAVWGLVEVGRIVMHVHS